MVEAATEFRKNSFNDSDSATLAKVATMFQNVSDESISASESASFIIAQMKAFNIEADDAEHIIDAVNAVSNSYAVSSGQLAKNLGNMSAALSVGNNSFEESLGLLTAGTEVTRNASKVSRALVSIQSRLNQVIDESSSTGQALTDWYKKHNIAILDQQGQLRSLYDVLTDVAEIWPELTKNEQAYYLNQQAGANQSQNLAAILSNFDTAAKATATAINSAGSAMKENEAYTESLDFQTNVLKADFQDLANNVIDKQLISALLTLGDAFLKVANTGLGTFITKVGLLAGTGWGLSSLLKVSNLLPTIATQFSNLGAVISLVAEGSGTFGAAIGAAGGAASVALPIFLAVSAALVGIVELAKALEENAHKAEKELEDLRTQIKEMEDPASEYSDLKSRVDELTDSELVRLGVLQSQLDTLKEQEEVLSRQQLAKWQKGQTEDQTTYVTNYDDYGYGITEAYTYNQAADSLKNLREEYYNLQKEKEQGAVSDAAYIARLQSIIDKNQDTTANLRALQTAYEETGDATYKLNTDQERFLRLIDAASTQVADGASKVADAVRAEQGAADGLEDALNQIGVATYDTSTAAAQLTASLFDQNGQLTEAGLQALSVDSSMRSMAQAELQAQQEAASANYSKLILEIQKVGSTAMITAGQLQTMMALAGASSASDLVGGLASGGADAESSLKSGFYRTFGKSAESDVALYNKWVSSRISAVGKSNYDKIMADTQKRLDEISKNFPAGTGGGSSGKSAEEKAAEEAEKQAKKAQQAQEKAAKESQSAYESAAKSAEQAAQEAARAAEQAAEEAKQKILDSIQELKDASDKFWESKTDAIEETNKELDRQKQLEEKLKALEEAKQKKILLYKNGQFQYDKDYGTIAKAQADYEETRDKIQRERELEQLEEMKDNATEIFNEMKDIVQNGGNVTQSMIDSWLSQMQADGADYYDSNKQMLNEWLEWARGAITEFTMSVSEAVSGSGNSSGSGSSNGGGDGWGLNAWATQHQGDKNDEDERGSPYVDAWYHLFKKELLNGLELGVNSVFVDYSKKILDGIDDVYEEQDYLQRNQAIKGLYNEMKKLTDQLGYIPDYLKEFMELGAGLKSNIDIIATQYAQNYDKLGSVGKTMLDAILSGDEDYMVANKSRIADMAGGTTEDLMWWSYVRTAGSAAAAKQLFDKRTEDDKKIAEGIYGDKLSQLQTMIDRAGGIVTDEIYEWATKAIGVLDPLGSGLTSMYSDVVTGNKYLYQSQAALEQLGYHGFLGNFGYTSEGGVSAPTAALIKSKMLGSTVSNTREESRNRLIAGNISRIEDNLEDVAHGQNVSQEYINKAKDFIAKTIQENSNKWFDTFDEAEKERLHVQNEQLRVLQSQIEAMESQNTTWDKMLDNEQDIIQDFDTDIQEQVEALRAQMAENSAAWWQTEDKETRDALHEANVELARQIEQLLGNGVQMKYEGHTGTWSWQGARNASGTHNFIPMGKDENIDPWFSGGGKGGINSATAGLSLVGENGPELRVLRRGDNIIPADKTANLWKWASLTPSSMLGAIGNRSAKAGNVSYGFNISNLQLPNVTDAKSLVQGLKNYALQYNYKR
uniref:Tail tape measure protein n=1 Tax=Siphoviridae sp. ctKcB20 TaxID=2827568 RepID=A0A8S5LKT5_9CAUD|nr:MAG TPA: tail tape measure protein [Siphoviridae sp. ctKcB20]